MGERSKGKSSHASYGSSGPDRFHPGVNAQEAYWKSHHRGNPSIPTWQRDRIQADNQTYYIPDNCRKIKNHVNSKVPHPDYASHQNSDPLFRHYQTYKSYRNKNGLNAGISRKEKDVKENDSDDDDEDDDGGDDDDGDDELGDDEYYENETNAKDEEDNPVESCVSRETIEKDNEDPGEEVEENYVPPNYRNKFEKLPTSMMEKLKMLDIAHALKMNQQRRLQKKYQVVTTQRECQDIQNEEVTDDVTEGDEEIPQRQFRKQGKVTNNHQRQANSWFARDHHENYNLMRAQQMYDYPRKYDTKQATILEENLDYYSKKRPCRFCGGTGSDPSVSRKINNCRVHDATKVNYNSKEKFDGESGDQGERFNNGRRKLNLLSMSPTNYASQKARRSRNTRSPART